jgi:TPR repeat protein
MLLKGQGTTQDAEEAFRWRCQAAEQGLVEAQRQVGDLYHAGRGVAADDALAAAWYEKAAEREGAGAATKLRRPNETRAAGAE